MIMTILEVLFAIFMCIIMGLGIIAVVVILSVLLAASGGGVSHDVPPVPDPRRDYEEQE